MISAIPLELMYSTFERSNRIRFTSGGRPEYVPSTVSFDVLVISPEKRKTVMGLPEGPAVSLTLTLVVLFCIYSPVRLLQMDHQARATASRLRVDPLHFIHQRLDQKLSHATRVLLTPHL